MRTVPAVSLFVVSYGKLRKADAKKRKTQARYSRQNRGTCFAEVRYADIYQAGVR